MNELWDRRFLEMAELVSNWSKDSSTRVGSVIVDGDKRVISTGYNGFPRKISDNPLDLEDRTRKYQKVLHSEINSILFAKRDLTGCSIYIYPFLSCADCTKVIIQSGITRVITVQVDKTSERYLRWKDSFEISMEMYREADVKVFEY
jgi:dCMP deaminase